MKLTVEEKAALREQEKAEKLAEKMAKKEEMKKIFEEEKIKKKEEREKLRLLKLEEKIRRDQLMKEWSRPRDDMECDDLKVLNYILGHVTKIIGFSGPSASTLEGHITLFICPL